MVKCVEVIAPKKCSLKTCKRTHTTTFKTCPTCREIDRKCKRKRKRLAAQKTIPDGHRCCKKCSRVQPEDQFQSRYARRKKPTVKCQTCRDIKHRCITNPTSATGQCRQVWINWRDSHQCAHCGETRYIEADHLRDKVHRCGDYPWWAWHGGVPAQKKELEKCQPLCRFCHRLKSKKERNPQRQACKVRRRKIVNAEKLRVGACERCNRQCTQGNVQGFDWAHKDRATKTICIGKLYGKSEDYFQKQWPIERAKCQLLCCLCHKDETIEENKRN